MQFFSSDSSAKMIKLTNSESRTSDSAKLVSIAVDASESGERKHVVVAAASNVEDEEEALPDCWNPSQKEDFCKKNEWLVLKNKKIGCKICKQVVSLGVERCKQGMNISKPWANIQISHYGDSKKIQMTSLRKKIHDHKTARHTSQPLK